MEKVLFFDIPKLKPNYFLIVIGICLLLIIIYSLTKVYLPDLMLEFTIMACLSDFIGFCLIYFIIEILRYSKNVKNKLSCILSDSEILRVLKLSEGIVSKRKLRRVATCIDISDMRWNYTIFLSEGNIYEFKCVVVKVLPNKIHLLLDLDTLKRNKTLRKPTLNAVKIGTKVDVSVLKLLTHIALGLTYLIMVVFVGYMKGIYGLMLLMTFIWGFMGIGVLFLKKGLISDRLLWCFDFYFKIPLMLVLPYVVSLFVSCGIPFAVLIGLTCFTQLPISYANMIFCSLIIGSFTIVYANKIFTRFILICIYGLGEPENEIYPATYRDRRIMYLRKILIDKSLVNMMVLLIYVVFLISDTMLFFQWRTHIFIMDINDAVKNSFIVYIAFKGFVAAKSNVHYSLRDIARVIEDL